MNSIKQFNRLLNSDDFSRFDAWTTYRKKLTNFIIDNVKGMFNSTLILGVGNSDDLDLSKLNKISKLLTLSDIDQIAMDHALTKYHLNQKNINAMVMDYIGLDSNIDWNNFVNELILAKDIDAINFYFNKLLTAIKKHKFSFTKKYDLVIISPIYTQLIFHQGLANINILKNLNYPLDFLNHIEVKLLDLMPSVINKFNENVISTLEDDSTLFVMSDIFEAFNDSEFYQEIKQSENIESIYEEYQKKYGIGIGDYGLLNMSEKIDPIKSKWFEWPFNNNKTLFVKVIQYKRIKNT